MSARIGGPSHSDRNMQFNYKRTLTVYSCASEKTEENVNMLFVMSAMRNIKKHIMFSAMMISSSLVTMSYTVCRYVLTCGSVPGIIWEVHSGLIVRRVELSVRGCLM